MPPRPARNEIKESRKTIIRNIQIAREHKNSLDLQKGIKLLQAKEGQMKRDEYRRVIGAAAELNLVDEVQSLLKSAHEAGRETTHLYNAAISGLGRAGNWQKSLEVLRSMEIPKDAVTFNAALSACQLNGISEQIPRILNDMREARIRRSTVTYNILLQERAKNEGVASALRVLDEMDEAGVAKDIFTFTSAITACQGSGSWETAFNLLRLMRQAGIRPTNAPYCAAISVCQKAGVWEPALDILKEMHSLGLKPNQITLSAAISAFRHQPSLVNALKTFQFMKIQGARANSKTYGSLMTAFRSKGMWEKAVELLDEMRGSMTNPSSKMVNMALEACVRANNPQAALELLKRAKEEMEIDSRSYHICMKACKNGGLIYHAEDILSQMSREEHGISTRVYNTYLELVARDKPAEMLQLFLSMEEEGIRKDAFTYNVAMNTYKKEGRWEKAVSLLEDMKSRGVEPDQRSFSYAIDSCAIEAPNLALALFSQMKKLNVERNHFVYSSVLKACIATKDASQALIFLREMEDEKIEKSMGVYTNAIEALKQAGETKLAMQLYLEGNQKIQDSEKELPGASQFKAQHIDLRQAHWKETWKKLRDNTPIEPEGKFTSRFAQPIQFLKSEPSKDVDLPEFTLNEDDGVVLKLQEQGLIESVLAQNNDDESSSDIDEAWEEVGEKDADEEEWEEIDPMLIPEIAEALSKQRNIDDES